MVAPEQAAPSTMTVSLQGTEGERRRTEEMEVQMGGGRGPQPRDAWGEQQPPKVRKSLGQTPRQDFPSRGWARVSVTRRLPGVCDSTPGTSYGARE